MCKSMNPASHNVAKHGRLVGSSSERTGDNGCRQYGSVIYTKSYIRAERAITIKKWYLQ